MAGHDLRRAVVTPQGLAGDRRWVVLDPDGNRVSARECHGLLGISPTPTATGLTLATRAGDRHDVATPGPDAPRVPTRMSRIDDLAAAGEAAGAWLSARLGRPLTLAYQDDPGAREIGEAHGGRDGEAMFLADAGPLLLVSEASASRLCDWVTETQEAPWLPPADALRRFRPNVVVDGTEAFEEDAWARVRIGEVTFRRGELCDRCVLTTIDLDTLQTTKEPIRTLARHRKWDGATWFGVRLVPELPGGAPGAVAVGDEVRPLG
jgi:uncharacterized protein YcbX